MFLGILVSVDCRQERKVNKKMLYDDQSKNELESIMSMQQSNNMMYKHLKYYYFLIIIFCVAEFDSRVMSHERLNKPCCF